MSQFSFSIEKHDRNSKARLGRITTAHSTFETPVFMPVGTRGTVKTLTHPMLESIGAKIILGNTYHLLLRPGAEIIDGAGGLHSFIRWPHSLLTDSGGFQVFSLSSLRTLTEEGVHFRSHIDGSKWFIGPKESIGMQRILGSDIVMAFDECPPFGAEYSAVDYAVERTTRWAHASRAVTLKPHQNFFAIVQGGVFSDLRQKSALALRELDCEGYAIGGLSVGEPRLLMNSTLEAVEPFLPADKPRYLMGVGTPRNLIEGVMRGVDMFDCVLPTRNARNGTAFTWEGKINISAARYAKDYAPLDPTLSCYASQMPRAYIRHLLSVGESSGQTLVSWHNLAFYLDFMQQLREAIRQGSLDLFYARVCAIYPD